MSRSSQMYLVLAVGFAVPVVSSTLVFTGVSQPGPATLRKFAFKIGYEVLGLSTLYVVLLKQNRDFRSIGFSFTPTTRDIGHSVLLFFGAWFSATVLYGIISVCSFLFSGHVPEPWKGHNTLFGESASILPLVFVLLNPFFEELLVRAFLMTEVEQRFASAKLAIIVSVALQTSYHLYQGVLNAAALGASFLVFSLYYRYTNRALPIILAHLYMDVLGLLFYVARLQR